MLIRTKYFFFGFGSAVALLLLLATLWFVFIDDLLVVENEPRKADAVICLGGEGGDFFRTRKAVGLWQQGYTPVVVFSGGTLSSMGIECSSARLSMQSAMELGLPQDAMILLDGSQSTLDEAVKTDSLCRASGWNHILVVTGTFHSRRTLRTFEKKVQDCQISLVIAPNPFFDPQRWYQYENSLVSVFSETVKWGYYIVTYGIWP
ncbi:hypothetical protein GF407_04540 [candidate division KSB1 bacterium]|nr:hypothetical protein [candidate division KSB1 bacterium]